jgi:hypothetical protein
VRRGGARGGNEVDFCDAIERLVEFAETLKSFPFAPGWSHDGLNRKITEISSEVFFGWMTEPCPRDLAIARDAEQLAKNLERLGCADSDFLSKLRGLAAFVEVRKGRGGDRRSGKRNQRQIVLQEAVRLYCEAHETPGFSTNGLLFHFVNGVREAILGPASPPFTAASVGAEFRRRRARDRRDQNKRH